MYGIYRSEPYKAFTNNIGKLFRSLQREFGRCMSKVYIDAPGGEVHIGWTFRKRENPFVWREVWVTVHDQPPTRTTKYHYRKLS
jgi:hypothetical protein